MTPSRPEKPNIKDLEAKQDIPSLIQALTIGDYIVACESVEALGRIGASAVEPLLALVHKRGFQSFVGYHASRALSEIGDSKAIDLFTEILLKGNCNNVISNGLDKCGWIPAKDEIGAAYWIAKDSMEAFLSFFI